MKARNPEFPGFVDVAQISRIANGDIHGIWIRSEFVEDLSPLRAFPHLASIHAKPTIGSNAEGRIRDLSPLSGMKLESLYLLDAVTDLRPLRGMPLVELRLNARSIKDLSPLQGMQLTLLVCYGFQGTELAALQGMPLKTLDIAGPNEMDLTPLADSPLTTLVCSAGAKNLRLLSKTPLETLVLDGYPQVRPDPSELAPFRNHATLKTINNKSASEFFREFDANK